MTKKSTELARALFKAIFTEQALRTCSLTGTRPKGIKADDVRPGLHAHAVTSILSKNADINSDLGRKLTYTLGKIS